MEDSSNLYPSKPKLKEEESKSNWSLTAFSLVVFILSFLVLFSDNIQFLIFLIVVLFIHELGHFLFMKLFKYKNVRMMFVPLMGAFVQGAKKVYSQKESFMVVMGGPIPGVLLGVVGAIIAFEYQMSWMLELSAVFILLNMIHLLPLDPLDGGQLFPGHNYGAALACARTTPGALVSSFEPPSYLPSLTTITCARRGACSCCSSASSVARVPQDCC